jgi:hypothetical protein
MAYSSEWASSTMLMYKQSSSTKSLPVGLTDGDGSNDCEMIPFFDDVFYVLIFLGGLAIISHFVGSSMSSSSSRQTIEHTTIDQPAVGAELCYHDC